MTTPSEAAKKWAEDWAIDHPAFAQAEVHNKYGYAGELGDYQDTAFKAGFDAGRAYERAEWEGEKEKVREFVREARWGPPGSEALTKVFYALPSWAREEKP